MSRRRARSRRHLWMVVVLACGWGVCGSGTLAAQPAATTSGTDELSPAELRELVRSLQARVEQLEAKQKDMPTKADVDDIYRRVMEDAEKRSRVFDESMKLSAGWENGQFFLKSADGLYSVRSRFILQFRGEVNHANGVKADDDASTQSGFEITRAKMVLTGTAFDPNFSWNFQTGYNRNGGGTNGTLTLEDFFGTYMIEGGPWGVRFGQFKDPVHHEQLVSDVETLSIDRSLADSIVGGGVTGRTQGVALLYGNYDSKIPLNGIVLLHDGVNSLNSDFRDQTTNVGVGVTDNEVGNWGVAARLEWKAMGKWAAYRDLSARTSTETLLVFGIGADMTQISDSNMYTMTADAQWELTKRLAIYGAVYDNIQDQRNGGVTTSPQNYGALIQAGYMLNTHFEPYVQYNVSYIDPDFIDGDAAVNEVVMGANWYFGKDGSLGNRAKFSIEGGWLPNGSPGTYIPAGVVASPDEQYFLRAQIQLIL